VLKIDATRCFLISSFSALFTTCHIAFIAPTATRLFVVWFGAFICAFAFATPAAPQASGELRAREPPIPHGSRLQEARVSVSA
jgi:hypothetical protein